MGHKNPDRKEDRELQRHKTGLWSHAGYTAVVNLNHHTFFTFRSDLSAHKNWNSGKGKGFKTLKFLEKREREMEDQFWSNLKNELGFGWEREM